MSKSLKSNLKHQFQQTVTNIVDPQTLRYECVCPKATRDLQVSKRTHTCYRCSQDYHTECLWPTEDNSGEYECPLCFLRYCLPDRPVRRVLFGGYLRQTKKNKIQYRINLPLESDLISDYVLEARCVRLNKENKYELTWPEHCTLHLNSKKIAEYKPLPASSSIKRRIDQEISFDKKLLSQQLTLLLEDKHQYLEGMRKEGNNQHFLVIVAVTPFSVDSIQNQLQSKHLSIEHSKHRLRDYLNRGNQDCQIDKLKVSLRCQFYSHKITIPVRSKHCRLHYQPFDLRGFILANINKKCVSLKWKCPICKKRAYDLEVDEYILKIIQSDPTSSEIVFNNQGELQLGDKGPQPPCSTSTSNPEGQSEQLKSDSKLGVQLIKKQGKCSQNESNSCQQIPVVDQSSQKSKIVFQDCIQLLDDDEDDAHTVIKPKRTFRNRNPAFRLNDVATRHPKKRQKKQIFRAFPINPEHQSSSVRPLESREVQIFHSDEEAANSPFSQGEQYNSKRDKRRRGNKKFYRRDRVGIDQPFRSIQKMAKTLVPSPLIRTVIPEAIRIPEVKLPQQPKKAHQRQAIQIGDSEQQNPEVIKDRKLQFHLSELQREKCWMGEMEQSQITKEEQADFLSICEHYVLSFNHRK